MSWDLSSWNSCFHVEVLYTNFLEGLHDFFFGVDPRCLNLLSRLLPLLCKSGAEFINHHTAPISILFSTIFFLPVTTRGGGRGKTDREGHRKRKKGGKNGCKTINSFIKK